MASEVEGEKGGQKTMVSLSPECVTMLHEMVNAPPYYGKVGSQSILVEASIRKYYSSVFRRRKN